MLVRKEPLLSGRDTEIDMIEREMEGGVVVVQPLDADESPAEAPTVPAEAEAPKAPGHVRRGPSRGK